MQTPAIAVVIPAYNAGRFVNEAIESVLAPTTSQWECVIVDDGSTDVTPSRLAAYGLITWCVCHRRERIRPVDGVAAGRDHASQSGDRPCRWCGFTVVADSGLFVLTKLIVFGRISLLGHWWIGEFRQGEIAVVRSWLGRKTEPVQVIWVWGDHMNKPEISVIIVSDGRWRGKPTGFAVRCAKLEYERTWSLSFLIDQTQSPFSSVPS